MGRIVSLAPLESLLKRNRTHFLYLHNVPDLEWFRSLVVDLSKRFELISYEQGVERVLAGRHDRPAVCFSFDDGFESAGDAAEIVRAAGATTCLFACPGIVGTDRAEQDRIFGRSQVEATMTWERLAELEAVGHNIGSHSMEHRNLGELGSAEQIREDLEASRAAIVAHVGRCDHFAWPFGRSAHISPEAIAIARAAGYRSIASAVRGSHRSTAPSADSIMLRHVVQPGQSLTAVLGHLVLADVGLDPHRSERKAMERLGASANNTTVD